MLIIFSCGIYEFSETSPKEVTLPETIERIESLLIKSTFHCLKKKKKIFFLQPPVSGMVSRDRRTLRCGRSNPGSNPGPGMSFLFCFVLFFLLLFVCFFSFKF